MKFGSIPSCLFRAMDPNTKDFDSNCSQICKNMRKLAC